MCQLIANPGGIKLPPEVLRKCFEQNPDGAGFSVARNGRLYTYKPYWTYARFSKAYRKAHREGCPEIIHFRLATHGRKDSTNTHPHVIGPDCVMAHNGILTEYVPIHGGGYLSDTVHFVRQKLRPLYQAGTLKSPETLKVLDREIGVSKIALLWSDGTLNILSESLGSWVDGAWYSAGHPDHRQAWFAEWEYPTRTVRVTYPTRPVTQPTAEGNARGIGRWINKVWRARPDKPTPEKPARPQPADHCRLCGRTLLGESEAERGYCGYCAGEVETNQYNSYPLYCWNCGVLLSTPGEKRASLCGTCTRYRTPQNLKRTRYLK